MSEHPVFRQEKKRRTWRKYHVAVDPTTHEVVAIELTEANIHDADAVADLVKNLTNIGNVYGDGAYPFKQSLEAITLLFHHDLGPVL